MLLNSQLKSASDTDQRTSFTSTSRKTRSTDGDCHSGTATSTGPLAVLLNGSWIVLKQSSRKGLSQFFSLGSFRSDWIDLLETVSKPFRGLQSPTLVRQHLIRPEL
jgi:hypothetical protein